MENLSGHQGQNRHTNKKDGKEKHKRKEITTVKSAQYEELIGTIQICSLQPEFLINV